LTKNIISTIYQQDYYQEFKRLQSVQKSSVARVVLSDYSHRPAGDLLFELHWLLKTACLTKYFPPVSLTTAYTSLAQSLHISSCFTLNPLAHSVLLKVRYKIKTLDVQKTALSIQMENVSF